ncbi:uracil-DNA glycosylase [Mobiluncus mulieris]|uniref:Uracil-DNA glycosylase n=1 Tax=Mobiluncus mulieris TaxID=2052 RepID=A0ABD4TW15_9ACTO|nr:uracil-DNA glycosylase [Mobiluncus mulieris]MCU9969066.1 uracil-DNA glycosylase [Mobiluncus mulieris]MCU9973555.1 uracil-DNA glycosylase [Mobiluncus mulieris]MCV0009488.1 uracil-DNA glycosylase [Mobiluncus mulieris]NMW75323.1 uracil-DNA glycosylase [Mobiluncus mulieris]NMX01450.1 uracil-DNA glycosylase [Mobiluncus mulieris]
MIKPRNKDGTMSGLENIMAPDWAKVMQPVESQIHAMGDFLRAQNATGRGYLPPGKQIFNAFTRPMSAVKVLIVGQDPYPTPGHAMGLAFSVTPGTEIPRSLQNIFKELESDLGFKPPNSGDLTPWANQGVMLLNRCLSVQPGAAGSHRGKGWEVITEFAIRALASRKDKALVAILWGNDARSTKQFMPQIPVIESVHPSPLSAARGFFGSRPFSRANQLLQSLGATPVDWYLA